MKRRWFIMGGAGLGLGAVLAGRRWYQGDPAAPVSIAAEGPFANVFLIQRQDQSHVDATLIYPVGEWHNPYAEGLAHYLEHLAWANIRIAGEDGGHHSNAFTSPMATSYLLKRPADRLSNTLERLIASAEPLQVDTAYAIKERDIVQREFDLARLGDPMDAVLVETNAALFGDSAYRRSTLGTKQSIATFDLETAAKLHDQSHHLATATLFVRGPVSKQEVQAAISDVQQVPSPRAELLPLTPQVWPAKTETDIKYISVKGISSPEVIWRRTVLPIDDLSWAKVYAARNILWEMVDSTRPGGLARPLRFDNFIASSFEFGVSTLGAQGLHLWFSAKPDSGVALGSLNGAVEKYLSGILEAPSEPLFEEMKKTPSRLTSKRSGSASDQWRETLQCLSFREAVCNGCRTEKCDVGSVL